MPSWRPRSFFDVLPLVFPFFLITQAEDRESPLVWLGWGLLAASVAVQVLIWRVEKADAVGNHHEQVRASHPPHLQHVAGGSSWLSETF